jgi:hypothetical protein
VRETSPAAALTVVLALLPLDQMALGEDAAE